MMSQLLARILFMLLLLCGAVAWADETEEIFPLSLDEIHQEAEIQKVADEATEREELGDLEESLEEDLDRKYDLEQKSQERRDRRSNPYAPSMPPITESMEIFHDDLSEDIVDLAEKIDSYFINRQIVAGRNRTNAVISNASSFIDETGYQNDFNFKFRLRLPQLQERIQLEFDDDDFDQNDPQTQNRAAQIFNGRQTVGSRGGLAFYEAIKGINTKLSGGAEYNNRVIGYWRFRINKDFLLSKKAKITAIHDYFDDTIKRRGQMAIVNFDYSISRFLVFRLLNEELYRDEFNTFETAHGFSFFHEINDRNFVSYNYRVNSLNPAGISTFYLNSHYLSTGWRHRIYRQHLYGEIAPAVIFPKEQGFEALPAITFKFELIFGNI